MNQNLPIFITLSGVFGERRVVPQTAPAQEPETLPETRTQAPPGRTRFLRSVCCTRVRTSPQTRGPEPTTPVLDRDRPEPP